MDTEDPTLAPVLLLSMPQMLDPNFARTVVLLAEYGTHGAFGLVVNRMMAEPAHEVIRPDPPMDIRKDVHLYVGGPVEPNRAWVLTNHREVDADALEIVEGVYLSAAPESDSATHCSRRPTPTCAWSSAMRAGEQVSSTRSWPRRLG